jgi:hypothetical protein
VEAYTNPVERKVSAWMNQKLLADFTRSEIFDALQQMASMKAPGPDGFPAWFFQQSWDTIQNEVCDVALYFFNTGILDEKINVTNIALIPKVPNLVCH